MDLSLPECVVSVKLFSGGEQFHRIGVSRGKGGIDPHGGMRINVFGGVWGCLGVFGGVWGCLGVFGGVALRGTRKLVYLYRHCAKMDVSGCDP